MGLLGSREAPQVSLHPQASFYLLILGYGSAQLFASSKPSRHIWVLSAVHQLFLCLSLCLSVLVSFLLSLCVCLHVSSLYLSLHLFFSFRVCLSLCHHQSFQPQISPNLDHQKHSQYHLLTHTRNWLLHIILSTQPTLALAYSILHRLPGALCRKYQGLGSHPRREPHV